MVKKQREERQREERQREGETEENGHQTKCESSPVDLTKED